MIIPIYYGKIKHVWNHHDCSSIVSRAARKFETTNQMNINEMSTYHYLPMWFRTRELWLEPLTNVNNNNWRHPTPYGAVLKMAS